MPQEETASEQEQAIAEATEEAAATMDEAAGEASAAAEVVAEATDEAAFESENEPTVQSDDVEAKPEEFKPLEEVQDEIRRSIAAPRAQEKMLEAMKSVRSRMSKYYKQYVMYEVRNRKMMRSNHPKYRHSMTSA